LAFASEVVGTDFKMQTIIDGAIESLFIEAWSNSTNKADMIHHSFVDLNSDCKDEACWWYLQVESFTNWRNCFAFLGLFKESLNLYLKFKIELNLNLNNE